MWLASFMWFYLSFFFAFCLSAYNAALVAIGYHVLTFRRWSDEYPFVLRFLVCFVVLVVELLWENVMVW